MVNSFAKQNHVFPNIYKTVLCSFFTIIACFHSPLMFPSYLILFMVQDKHGNTWKIAQLKSFGSKAVERKDYFSASAFYTKVCYIMCFSFPATNYSSEKNACEHADFQAGF